MAPQRQRIRRRLSNALRRIQGWIEQERSGRANFYLYNPSDEIRRHSHWTCFQHRGSDWYLVHMGKEPKDVSSGIITIEKTHHGGLPTMKTTHLENKRTTLIEKREELLGRFSEAVRGRRQVDALVHDILHTNDFLESLERIALENSSDVNGTKRYAVSSWFLHESFKKLTADQDEQFFFITGAGSRGCIGSRPVGRICPPAPHTVGRCGRYALDAQSADQARTVRPQVPGPLSQPSR